MRLLNFILLVPFGLIACNKKEPFHQEIFWTQNQHGQKLPKLNSFKEANSTVQIGSEIIETRPQKLGSLRFSGGSIKMVKSDSGAIKTVVGKELNLRPSDVFLKEAEALSLTKWEMLTLAKAKFSHLWQAKEIFAPELVVTANLRGQPELEWHIDYIDNSGAHRLRLSTALTILSLEKKGLHFQEGSSLVFPMGPKQSDLTTQILIGLVGDGTLSTGRVVLNSEDGNTVKEPNHAFLFDTDDVRFNQVQAFYFIQKTLLFAESQWGLLLPFSLQVKLRTGFPEKTNAAFYYKGQIRLGDGDGVTYQNIPRDPSIVSHEVAHAIIDAVSSMGNEGETGSINEGFADYITAAIWNQPYMGHTAYLKGPYKRTVNSLVRLNEKRGGLYFDSQIISGLLWNIHQELGDKRAHKLAIKTLARLSESAEFHHIRPALENALADAGWSNEEKQKVQDILKNRGF